jgi:nitric-oxide synthase, bacterial
VLTLCKWLTLVWRMPNCQLDVLTVACADGRYADTEICRNLSDECRYNMLPTIAEKLGYSIATNGTMWRDAALVALNEVSAES